MSAPTLTPTAYPEPECRTCRALLTRTGLCPRCDLGRASVPAGLGEVAGQAVSCHCTDCWRQQPLDGCECCGGTGTVRL